MKKPEELVGDAIIQYTEVKDKNEILRGIYGILQAFDNKSFKDWTLDELSRAAGELSIYLVNLGDMLADAQLHANSSYIYRKLNYITEFKALRKNVDNLGKENTVKDAEFGADLETIPEYDQQLLTQHRADSLKLLYENCSRLISVIQSRLKHYESERVKLNLDPDERD